MNQGEAVSTQTGKVFKKTSVVKEALTKEAFANLKEKELLEKGNLPAEQIKSLTDSFRSVVEDGLTEVDYKKIWEKTFYRGHK